MSFGQKVSRTIFFSVWAVFMTALTYVLGSVALKVLRHTIGRLGYWSLCATITALLFAAQANPLAIAFLSLVVLIGFFTELEDLHLSFMVSAFFTLLLNSLIAGGAVALWISRVGPKWSQTVQATLESLFKPLVSLNASLQINYADVMVQLPSVLLILWIVAIYLSVLLESRLNSVDPKPLDGGAPTMRQQLADLRLPDGVVWLFIGALLGAFGGFDVRGLEAVSVNILNVSFVLFFFQGIAVVAKFFEKLRMGSFWQFVFMLLIVVHLFLFVSLVGLTDYWMDFRTRMNKRTTEFNRET